VQKKSVFGHHSQSDRKWFQWCSDCGQDPEDCSMRSGQQQERLDGRSWAFKPSRYRDGRRAERQRQSNVVQIRVHNNFIIIIIIIIFYFSKHSIENKRNQAARKSHDQQSWLPILYSNYDTNRLRYELYNKQKKQTKNLQLNVLTSQTLNLILTRILTITLLLNSTQQRTFN